MYCAWMFRKCVNLTTPLPKNTAYSIKIRKGPPQRAALLRPISLVILILAHIQTGGDNSSIGGLRANCEGYFVHEFPDSFFFFSLITAFVPCEGCARQRGA